jgi:hypothetical protein
LATLSDSNSDIVDGCRVTVMSAPTRASQNGDIGCFTDTADPFGLSLDDHVMSEVAPARGAMRAFDAGLVVIRV